MEGTGRFDTDEFDQEYVDGGIRDDVRYVVVLIEYIDTLQALTNELYAF